MRIQINTNDASAAAKVEQLTCFYRTRLASQVESVEVTVDDVLDSLSRPLLRCHVRARLGPGDTLEVTETQSDLGLAITRALDRVVRTVHRRFNLQQMSRTA